MTDTFTELDLPPGPIPCEDCGSTESDFRTCWAGHCMIVFCAGCRRDIGSIGPVGCPGCTFGRRDPRVSAVRRAYSLRRRKRRFKR